jgi:hypothetical protein
MQVKRVNSEGLEDHHLPVDRPGPVVAQTSAARHARDCDGVAEPRIRRRFVSSSVVRRRRRRRSLSRRRPRVRVPSLPFRTWLARAKCAVLRSYDLRRFEAPIFRAGGRFDGSVTSARHETRSGCRPRGLIGETEGSKGHKSGSRDFLGPVARLRRASPFTSRLSHKGSRREGPRPTFRCPLRPVPRRQRRRSRRGQDRTRPDC